MSTSSSSQPLTTTFRDVTTIPYCSQASNGPLTTLERVAAVPSRRHNAIKPIPAETLPTKVTTLIEAGIPVFEPAFRVHYEASKPLLNGTPLELFLALFDERSIDTICENTNRKARSERAPIYSTTRPTVAPTQQRRIPMLARPPNLYGKTHRLQ